jgi:hypothetical protein
MTTCNCIESKTRPITNIKFCRVPCTRNTLKKLKMTIRNRISTVLLTVTCALILVSCNKLANDYMKNEKVAPSSPPCAPIPDILNVPIGNRLLLQTFARGVQIYEVKRSATDPNVFSWVNIAPLATLYTNPNFTNEVIHHFAGPSWEFIKGPEKGEKVVATKLQGVTQDVTAIQWLSLKAVDSLSSPNNKITFIQRICTVGGLAPTTGADVAHLGKLDSIPYTASYLFYIKDTSYPYTDHQIAADEHLQN